MNLSVHKKKNAKGLEKVLKHFQSLDDLEILTGYFEEQGNHQGAASEGNDISYVDLMEMQHFGTDKIPSRPLLSISAGELKRGYDKDLFRFCKDACGQVGRLPSNSKKIGREMRDYSKAIFGDVGAMDSNAPLTQALKGGRDEPLVDTGELRDNLAYKTSLDDTPRTGG